MKTVKDVEEKTISQERTYFERFQEIIDFREQITTVTSSFNLAPSNSYERYLDKINYSVSSEAALYGDWQKVSKDLQKASNEVSTKERERQ